MILINVFKEIGESMMQRIAYRFDKNVVTFFDRSNGTKIRVGIGPYRKATYPELCDIKITDWCDMGCKFCYQDSTLLGRHATMNNMKIIATQLGKAKVYEVALGGGETTGHPHFIEILQMFRDHNIIPNFTTKKPAMVRKYWNDIGHLIGGFAYSAENAAQVKSAGKLLRNIPNDKASLHYVMGLGDKEHFKNYLRAASEINWRVTLLGYKTTGRGKNVIPFPYDWWIDAVNELIEEGTCPSLSIDTPLAEQYDGVMPVEKFMYHTREGAFSMYIDAVSMEMGASSFDEKATLQPFNNQWKKTYAHL